jgi:sugar (pentulose or hexulose) kinase
MGGSWKRLLQTWDILSDDISKRKRHFPLREQGLCLIRERMADANDRPLILSLDIGTSKVGALALAPERDAIVAACSRRNDTDLPGLPRGRHEQAPPRVLELCLDLLDELLKKPDVRPDAVTALALTGQMHSVLLADAANTPLTPLVTWLDRRTLEDGPGFLGASKQALPPDAAQTVGCDLHPGYGAATLAWWSARGLLPAGCRALTISDYVAASLCGVAATDPTHAASWGLLDIGTLAWNEAILKALGIPRSVLPDIRPSGTPLAPLSQAMAKRLGLPGQVMVHVPLGDNQASVIGATGIRDDRAVVNLGTGGQVSIPRRSPRFVPGVETRPMAPVGYLLVGATLCGGLACAYLCRLYREVAKALTGQDVSEADAYRCLDDLAASAPAGADGLEADTRFAGTRGNPHVRGTLTGISADNFTAANLARAVLEGTVRELADLAHAAGLEGASGLVASGNAAHQNPMLLDIIQREFRLPCRLSEQARESALGAARLAAGYQR